LENTVSSLIDTKEKGAWRTMRQNTRCQILLPGTQEL